MGICADSGGTGANRHVCKKYLVCDEICGRKPPISCLALSQVTSMRNRQSSPENPAELISHLEMKKTLVRLQRRTGAAKKKTQSTGAKSLTRAKYDISSPVRVLKNSKKSHWSGCWAHPEYLGDSRKARSPANDTTEVYTVHRVNREWKSE